MELLALIWSVIKVIIIIFLVIIMINSFWYGSKFETKGIKIEVYGIERFFK